MFVTLEDNFLDWTIINNGVSQGTVLKPPIFLLYNNNFKEKVQGNFEIIVCGFISKTEILSN